MGETLLNVAHTFFFLRKGRVEAALSCLEASEIIFMKLKSIWSLLLCQHRKCMILLTLGDAAHLTIEAEAVIKIFYILDDGLPSTRKLLLHEMLSTLHCIYSQCVKTKDIYQTKSLCDKLLILQTRLQYEPSGSSHEASSFGINLDTFPLTEAQQRISNLLAKSKVLIILWKAKKVKHQIRFQPNLRETYSELRKDAIQAARSSAINVEKFLRILIYETFGSSDEAIDEARLLCNLRTNSRVIDPALKEPPVSSQLRNLKQRRDQVIAFMLFTRLGAGADARRHLEWLKVNVGADWWEKDDDSLKCRVLTGRLMEDEGDAKADGERTAMHLEALKIYHECIRMSEKVFGSVYSHELTLSLGADVDVQEAYAWCARTLLKLCDMENEHLDKYYALFFYCMEAARARSLRKLFHEEEILSQITQDNFPKEEFRTLRKLASKEQTWAKLRIASSERWGDEDEEEYATPTANRASSVEEQDLKDSTNKTYREKHIEAIQRLQDFESSFFEKCALSDPASLKLLREEISSSPEGLFTLEGLKSVIQDDTLVLEVFSFKIDLFVWAVSKKGILQANHRKVSRLEVSETVNQFVRESESGSSAEKQNFAGEILASWFLSPCKESINKVSRLIIVPHMKSMTIPFCALPWESNEPLGARKSISYLYCASALRHHAPNQPIRFDASLAVGCNQGGVKRKVIGNEPLAFFPVLSCAEEEASNVADSLSKRSGAQARLLVGSNATRVNFLESVLSSHVLHLSTHSEFLERTPMESYINLAGKDYISAIDLLNQRIDLDLVVLGACNAASGEPTNGGDLLGLVLAFLIAGAKRVLAPVWPVYDAVTHLFMKKFYEELFNHHEPDKAVQLASEALRKKYSDDKTKWAPFVLIG